MDYMGSPGVLLVVLVLLVWHVVKGMREDR
jgi:hypothetical protein